MADRPPKKTEVSGADHSKAVRIGHIITAGNTVLEPLTYALNRSLDGVSHHFSRISVTQLAVTETSEKQFQMERMLAAARLLSEAPLDVIVWNGTSASWRGLENDLALCEAITAETGIPATTSTIAFYNAFRHFGWERIALAVPYAEDITRQIEKEYIRQGFKITGSAFLGIRDNAEIGTVQPEQVRALLRNAAKSKPSCIAVVCTNFPATALVAGMEAELAVPIVDSIAVTFWEACRVATRMVRIPGWGCLLEGSNEVLGTRRV